jgi:cytochrome P450
LKSSLNPEATGKFIPSIVDIASRALARWEAKGAAGVKAHREMKHLTFEVIMQVRFRHGCCMTQREMG